MGSYYPAFLDLQGRLCVVVGGGQVAERKVSGLLECGARVRLIAPEASPTLEAWAKEGRVGWEGRPYREGDLAGAFLAIAATDAPEVNEAVAGEAAARRVLLNVADVPRLCTFIAPAVIRRGKVTLAVSTGGLSPALARRLRQELEQSRALQYADLAELVSQLRADLRKRDVQVDPEQWQTALSDEVVELYQAGRQGEARQLLLKALEPATARPGGRAP
jgi:precorrin-2 dehydrogenase/sirohydrochlorin ferrochelatase